MLKDFSLKFIDIMVGIVLGLGFQWWTSLHEPWQYIAFIFAYIDIVDYWIDYSPSLNKFPPKREVDVMIDIAIMFSLFLYIYATQLSIGYFLGAFILWRAFDYIWLLRAKIEHHPRGSGNRYVSTWLRFNVLEALVTAGAMLVSLYVAVAPLTVLTIYILVRLGIRIIAGVGYKKAFIA